jgi:glycerophosphoryl diester phosphodiesterase
MKGIMPRDIIARPPGWLLTILLAGPLATLALADDDPTIKLIAHRGGVVDDKLIENSLPGLQAAIDRGYWMVEADLRRSKDGRVIVHHNADFKLYYNDPRKLADMTWDEIKQFRSTPGDLRPIEFHEYAAACKGKIRIMLDVKGPGQPQTYYEKIEAALRENDLLKSTFVIGHPTAKIYFKSKARVSVSRLQLRTAIDNGEDAGRLYFLFEHANRIDEATYAMARRARVPVVVSINVFHYPKNEHMQRAEADVRRLRKIGVTYFQIDSVYDRWLRE